MKSIFINNIKLLLGIPLFVLVFATSCESKCIKREPRVNFMFNSNNPQDGLPNFDSVEEINTGRPFDFNLNQSLALDASSNETGYLFKNGNRTDTLIFSYSITPATVAGDYCIILDEERVEFTTFEVLSFSKSCESCDYEIFINY